MDVRAALDAVRRRWIVVVSAALIFGAVAGVVRMSAATVYTATTQGFVSVTFPLTRSPNVLTSGSQFILARMSSYAELASTSQVLGPVASTLGLDETAGQLRTRVSAHSVLNTAFIDVDVVDRRPAVAARIADAIMVQLGATIGRFENGTVQLGVSTPAAIPAVPSNRPLGRTVVLAVGGGLVVGLGAALLLERLGGPRRRRGGRHVRSPL